MAHGRACSTLFIASTIGLLLLVQLSQAKKAATLGGEFDMLGKACQSSLKMMVTSASQIGSCTQLAVSWRHSIGPSPDEAGLLLTRRPFISGAAMYRTWSLISPAMALNLKPRWWNPSVNGRLRFAALPAAHRGLSSKRKRHCQQAVRKRSRPA